MEATRARTFEFDVALDDMWAARSTLGGSVIHHEEDAWTPEHLVLAGLARCSLKSFRFHARRAGLEPRASARAHGVVSRRESDGRYAFVETDLSIDVRLIPAPGPELLLELMAKGERDCFVAASLTAQPAYRWTVNGERFP